MWIGGPSLGETLDWTLDRHTVKHTFRVRRPGVIARGRRVAVTAGWWGSLGATWRVDPWWRTGPLASGTVMTPEASGGGPLLVVLGANMVLAAKRRDKWTCVQPQAARMSRSGVWTAAPSARCPSPAQDWARSPAKTHPRPPVWITLPAGNAWPPRPPTGLWPSSADDEGHHPAAGAAIGLLAGDDFHGDGELDVGVQLDRDLVGAE
jgi:hypothetical protein